MASRALAVVVLAAIVAGSLSCAAQAPGITLLGQTFGEDGAASPDGPQKRNQAADKQEGDKLIRFIEFIGDGNAALRDHRPEDALKLFERAAELVPDNPRPHVDMAMAYRDMGKTEEALKSLEKANSLRESAHAHIGLAYLRLDGGEPSRALVHARKAIELEPKSGQPYVVQGECLARLGRTDDAVASYRRAVAIEPSARAMAGLGWALFEKKDYDGARESFAKAVDLDPEAAPSGHDLEARIARAKGDLDAAVREMTKAVEGAPNDATRRRYREGLGELYLAQGNYAKASQAYGKRNVLGLSLSKAALGISVVSVVKNGPADLAGVRKGDVLVEFDGRPLADVAADAFAKDMVGAASFGGTVRLKLDRSGETIDKAVVVGIVPDLPRRTAEANAPSAPPAQPAPEVVDEARTEAVASRLGPSLDILSAAVEPSTVPANGDFKVVVRLKAALPGGQQELTVTLSCGIVAGGKLVFQAPDASFKVPNGTAVDVEKTLSAGPKAGTYTVRVKLAVAGLEAEDSVEFAIGPKEGDRP